MATADEYAAWIVKNKDKQGTQEFATVAQAYELAKQEENAARADTSTRPKPTPVEEPGMLQQIAAVPETALTLATGGTTGVIGGLGGFLGGLAGALRSGEFGTQEAARRIEQAALEGMQSLTYTPRSQAAQEQLQAIGEVASVLPPVLPQLAAPGMAMQAARQQAPLASATAQRAAAAAAPVAQKAAQTVVQAPVRAARAVGEAVGIVSPEKAEPSPGMRMAPGGSVGAQATEAARRRVATAEQMPVPFTLTRGGATRDAEQLAFEKEAMKGPLGAPLRQRAEENNLQALQNMDALIDMTSAQAPDLAATGSAVTKALSSGYQAEKNRVNVLYNKARKSSEAQEVVDTNAVITIGSGDDQIQNSLIGYLNSKVTGVPSAAVPDTARKIAIKMGIAEQDESGNLIGKPATVGQMEDFRRELSGTAPLGDRVGLREETILKSMIDAQTESVSGPDFRAARAARAQMARKYEKRAIVARLIQNVRGMDDPKVPADQVFRASIVNSSPEEITFLRRVLQTSGKDGQQAWNELQGAFGRHLRDQATKGLGLDSNDNPLVSPAQLHQAVRQFDANGRLDLILGKKNAQTVRDLDDLVRYVNTVPPGTLINSSGTTGTIVAALLETGAQTAVTGIPIPIVMAVREIAKMRKSNKTKAQINDALNALPTVPPVQP